MKITTKKLVTIAALAACSIVLVMLIRIPFPPAPFLEYDPADIPILIGTFLFGPVWGLVLTVLVSVLQGLTVSAAGGPIGIVMHMAGTGSFVLVAGCIYRLRHTRSSAYIAMGAGIVVQTAVMVLMNLWLTPIFMLTPVEEVIKMILPVLLPFNLLRAGINAVVTALVYKRISNLIHHTEDRA